MIFPHRLAEAVCASKESAWIESSIVWSESNVIMFSRKIKESVRIRPLVRDDVMRAIDVMALNQSGNEQELVRALTQAGFSKLDASQLVTFVPLAFSRPVLERLGVTDIAQTFSVMTKSGRWVRMALSTQPVYLLASDIMSDPTAMALMDNSTFKNLVNRCPVLNAANEALNAGKDLASMSGTVALHTLKAEELGYLPWWRQLQHKIFG